MRRRNLMKLMSLCALLILFIGSQVGAANARELKDKNAPPLVELPAGQVPPTPSMRPTLSVPILINGAPVVEGESGVQTTGPGQLASVTANGPIVIAPQEKWIRVDLGKQRVYAYEGEQLVRQFIISSGLPETPTVTGIFRIWMRTPSQTMSGGSDRYGAYYLENVQWVQYFYEDYGFHGTYWHDKFGQPMSHGCVNMTNEDAEWLFKWAMPEWEGEKGWLSSHAENNTLVVVHE